MSVTPNQSSGSEQKLWQYINLKLAAIGCPTAKAAEDTEFQQMVQALLLHQRETERLLANYLCPADFRIQNFLEDYLYDLGAVPKLPVRTFVLDRVGVARAASLPPDKDVFVSEIVSSFRVKQGVLHNPKSDRRTTEGIFHVTEGGLPIPDDKRAVPKATFAQMLRLALAPPREMLRLPFTSNQSEQAECFVSLLLRPIVCPEVPGSAPQRAAGLQPADSTASTNAPAFISQKSMEIRFFAPGTLVSNLDFVETIFGNAGDPFLPENDAGLDVDHWTGHTGCVILAPHLVSVTKKQAGLPPWDSATERQRRDGMCWKDERELYNDGVAFKLTARDERGVIVTIIADNYFGYCKKEVKTQISFSANLYGLCEEEHAGGALVFPSYDLGEEFSGFLHVRRLDHSFEEVVRLYGEMMDVRPEGYAIDRKFPDILYVSEDVRFDLRQQTVSWPHPPSGSTGHWPVPPGDSPGGTERKLSEKTGASVPGNTGDIPVGESPTGTGGSPVPPACPAGTQTMKLLPGKTYVRPSGYKVHMERVPGTKQWRLIGTVAEGVFCHKPCTVSGGGKSEISKAITDAIIQGPVFVADFKKEFDLVAELIKRDYANRFKDPAKNNKDSRAILSPERSLGSVIKLLTPASREYSTEYNNWLRAIPQHIRELVFVVKRFHKPEWGADWRRHFSVDIVNGVPGYELKFENRKIISSYVRVGYATDGAWRTFGLRKDFHPAAKIAMEDDISASVVVPTARLGGFNSDQNQLAVKFATNCESRLFQRPDDAIHRGYDKQTEADFAQPGNFFSNYEPLTPTDAKRLIDDVIDFGEYTEPIQKLIREAAQNGCSYFVAPSHPRLVNGKPTKNPRYLQIRPDLARPSEPYLAEMAIRLQRRIPLDQPVPKPVNAVVPGRRNNPPDAGIRSLAVFGPIHYMELPELFMEFICSMTGKSPSTTGAGSEGALTKGPFNALPPIIDLNNALVSYLLTGHEVFVTAAGFVGPHVRVDHDISLLVPEILCRMSAMERDTRFLIRNNYLEKCRDFDHAGRRVLASRLGYRITARFVRTYFGRMFNHPNVVFTDEMLRPETQDIAVFVDGMDNIVSTQRRVAQNYFNDGSIEMACPPLRALLHIMAHDQFEGLELSHAKIRALFTRDNMLASDWYANRLKAKQEVDIKLRQRGVFYLAKFLSRPQYADEAARLRIEERLANARTELARAKTADYLGELHGTLGANPLPATRFIK